MCGCQHGVTKCSPEHSTCRWCYVLNSGGAGSSGGDGGGGATVVVVVVAEGVGSIWPPNLGHKLDMLLWPSRSPPRPTYDWPRDPCAQPFSTVLTLLSKLSKVGGQCRVAAESTSVNYKYLHQHPI